MTQAELKPCPFCGSKDLNPVFLKKQHFSPKTEEIKQAIGCEECETHGPPKSNHKKAVEAWNRREVTYGTD